MAFDPELARLAADLRAASAQAGTMARAAVRKTALDIQADAQAVVTVDTGNLKNSIGVTVTGNATLTRAEIGPTAAYGGFVELGTSRMPGRPYLQPAFDRRAPILEARLQQLGGLIL